MDYMDRHVEVLLLNIEVRRISYEEYIEKRELSYVEEVSNNNS
jgi:hypothetical protein